MYRALYCVLVVISSVSAIFKVPEATVEVLDSGFKVSIPDVEGISLFAFHGKLNEKLKGREGGTYSKDILEAEDGRWTFYEPYTELKAGDIIYYWTYVDYFDGRNKLGYTRDNQRFEVTSNGADGTGGATTKRPTTTRRPVTQRPPVTTTCMSTVTTINGGKQSCKGTEIFSDKFNQISNKYWNTEMRFAGEPDYEFVMYNNQPDVMNVATGHLVIKPTLTEHVYDEGFVTSSEEFNFGSKCTGKVDTTECVQKAEAFLIKPPVLSAQINTKNKFSFKYGRIEIRAKLPQGDWLYPELFLNPQSDEYGPSYESGQIRIAFTPGNSRFSNVLYGGCVLGNSTQGRKYAMKEIRKATTWTSDFHKFVVDWKPHKISVSVDGNVYGNIFPPEGGFASDGSLNLKHALRWKEGSQLAPFDQEMYITIGVGAGGHNFPDRSDGTKPWVNTDGLSQKKFFRSTSQWYPTWGDESALEIDYVKVTAI